MKETIYYECNEENYKFILNELHNKDNEIKRQEDLITELNDVNEYITDNINSLEVENKKIHSIIKEVREYIEKHIAMFKNGDVLVDMNVDELLDILDKVGEE